MTAQRIPRRAQLSLEFLLVLSLVLVVFASVLGLFFSFSSQAEGILDIAEAEGAALVLESAKTLGMPFEFTNFSWQAQRIDAGRLYAGVANVPIATLNDGVASAGYQTYSRAG